MTPVTRALFRAVADGDVNLLRGLLAQGTDVNSRNQAGQTALMLAAAFKRNEVVSLLLSNGADVEARDDLGLTVHDWAGESDEMIELLTTVTSENAKIAEVTEPRPITNTAHDRSKLFTDEPVLKGLAAAILRDHSPRNPVNPSPATSTLDGHEPAEVNIDEQPTPVHQIVDASLIDATGNEASDDTWGTSKGEIAEDTTAPVARPFSSSRIFDLRSNPDIIKPISKVEIPTFNSPNTSRSGVVVWALVVIVLAAGGFGGYRLATYLLASRSTNTATPTTTTPPVQPPPVARKLTPVVGGDVVGAELHLPDAKYPSDSTQSGTVTVQVRVSRKGIVIVAKAIDGDESLKAAAEDAAKRSAFSPEKLQDKPSLIDGTITYHFIQPQPGALPTEQPNENNTSNSVTITTGGPLAGTELKLVEPDYPSSAGTVTVVVRVSRSGRVVSWRPLEGEQRLRAAAVRAAKRSTFSPDKLPGDGEVVGTITYTFK